MSALSAHNATLPTLQLSDHVLNGASVKASPNNTPSILGKITPSAINNGLLAALFFVRAFKSPVAREVDIKDLNPVEQNVGLSPAKNIVEFTGNTNLLAGSGQSSLEAEKSLTHRRILREDSTHRLLGSSSSSEGCEGSSQCAGKAWSLKDAEGRLQELSTAIISDCAFRPGTVFKTQASQAILDVMGALNLTLVSQSQYTPPAAIGLKVLKGYTLAFQSPWPIGRIGVKGANSTLVEQFAKTLSESLKNNTQFQDAQDSCVRDTSIGVGVGLGVVVVVGGSILFCFIKS